MSKLLLSVPGLLLCAAFAATVHAGHPNCWTGYDWMQRYTDSHSRGRQESAFYYVVGVADVAVSNHLQCPPEAGVQYGLLEEIAARYMREHPAEQNLCASRVMVTAWRLAYPCRRP
jgi:hypothetical protein